MFDRDSCGRLVEEPNAEGRYQHNTDHYGEQEARDIGRAELSDAWHDTSIISKCRIRGRCCGCFDRDGWACGAVILRSESTSLCCSDGSRDGMVAVK
jgi:hypothetical protein